MTFNMTLPDFVAAAKAYEPTPEEFGSWGEDAVLAYYQDADLQPEPELRAAAYHAAGHLLAAFVAGQDGDADLAAQLTRVTGAWHRAECPQFFSAVRGASTRPFIVLAGFVAEAIMTVADYSADIDIDDALVNCALHGRCIVDDGNLTSDTNIEVLAAGGQDPYENDYDHGFDEGDVVQVASTLMNNWGAVRRVARSLISDEATSIERCLALIDDWGLQRDETVDQ